MTGADVFRDRRHAGRVLAQSLSRYAGRHDVIVLALPRGGVPVAFEVAAALRAPLDVFVVRKLGVPGHEEYAMGAIASGGVRVLNDEMVHSIGLPEAAVERVLRAAQFELERRERLYRDARPPPEVRGRTAIVVDDGLATGSTMRAAVAALRLQRPARIVVAVPTAAADTCELLRREADEVVCSSTPEPYRAVGLWYEDFSQTSDEDVRELLERARQERAAVEPHALRIPAGAALLDADLSLPAAASGLVLFAHGSGSSRFSPRNRHVARLLNEAGLATVLADLLTRDEEALDERTHRLRFDIALLAGRLVAATDWLRGAAQTGHLPLGCFGASTGAAAALIAAAERRDAIRAVVSRGGRPDLAGTALAQVRAPTLLVVGGNDGAVIELNRQALAQMGCEKKLLIVPGATHLFEEPGALDSVAALAREWFLRHLAAESTSLLIRAEWNRQCDIW